MGHCSLVLQRDFLEVRVLGKVRCTSGPQREVSLYTAVEMRTGVLRSIKNSGSHSERSIMSVIGHQSLKSRFRWRQ
jgi:hypothetical protein